MSQTQAEQYFYSVVEDIVREFAIMARLKGTANVVGYEDHTVNGHQDGIGWDILIRMEPPPAVKLRLSTPVCQA